MASGPAAVRHHGHAVGLGDRRHLEAFRQAAGDGGIGLDDVRPAVGQGIAELGRAEEVLAVGDGEERTADHARHRPPGTPAARAPREQPLVGEPAGESQRW